MNIQDIQDEITEQAAKLTTLKELLKKDVSNWNKEEKSSYGNKATATVEKDLTLVSIKLLAIEQQLLDIELLFAKDFNSWGPLEKRKYGDTETSAEEGLRKKMEQLREQQTILLRAKEKSPIIGTGNFLDSGLGP